eukprot:TRINITY_DN6255_c0_g1_i3.p1 TRINITY_DN6255_c0_g1~~TRINITY_DN6255_c0_g1_i3.p1  ORF type:complete len:353 (+),score=71.49 TRINITY_DN6255_c0_g1_i3:43-1101(+)
MIRVVLILIGLIVLNTADVLVPCAETHCFRVGFASAWSGGLAEEGIMTKDGYTLWAQTINARGGIVNLIDTNTYHIELIGYDDQTDTDLLFTLYTNLIEIDHVDFLLGPFGSTYSSIVSDVANTSGYAVVLSNAAADFVYENGFDNIFGIPTTTSYYSESALEALQSLGAQTVALLHSDNAFAAVLAEGILGWIDHLDFTLVGDVTSYFSSNVTQDVIDGIVDILKGEDPDILICSSLLIEGEMMVQSLDNHQWKPKALWLSSAVGSPDFIKDMGSLAEYVIGPVQWDQKLVCMVGFRLLVNFIPDNDDVLTNYTSQTFYDSFIDEFEYVPSYIAASAFAGGLVLQVFLIGV